MAKIGFIGVGNMGLALVKAIKSKLEWEIIVSDVKQERLELAKNLGIKTTSDNKQLERESDIIFICVKPQDIDGVLEEIKDTKKLVISIVAGISLQYLESKLKLARVIRVMPNAACLVNEMAAGFAPGEQVTKSDIEKVQNILNSAGKAFLLNEDLLDVVTALSGSGPAFIAYITNCFIEVAKKLYLPLPIAKSLTIQTLLGTAKLLMKLEPEEVISLVSSPKGTTVAGMHILKKSDMKEIIMNVIQAATKRSKEIKNSKFKK